MSPYQIRSLLFVDHDDGLGLGKLFFKLNAGCREQVGILSMQAFERHPAVV